MTTQLETMTKKDTRQRLIEAATEVFSETGYRAAKVQEICRLARANIAAVNYYFGGKERLYLEVLRQSCRQSGERYPLGPAMMEEMSAEERLRTFIRTMLQRIFDDSPSVSHGRLMAHEMFEPTQALDMMVEEVIRPMSRLLAGIIRDLLGPAATDETVRLSASSIVGQCMYYHNSRSMLSKLYPELKFTPDEIERLAEHITRFSLSALRERANPQPNETVE